MISKFAIFIFFLYAFQAIFIEENIEYWEYIENMREEFHSDEKTIFDSAGLGRRKQQFHAHIISSQISACFILSKENPPGIRNLMQLTEDWSLTDLYTLADWSL